MVENTMERFFAGANVKKVYGRPVQQGDTTIIPVADITVAGEVGDTTYPKISPCSPAPLLPGAPRPPHLSSSSYPAQTVFS